MKKLFIKRLVLVKKNFWNYKKKMMPLIELFRSNHSQVTSFLNIIKFKILEIYATLKGMVEKFKFTSNRLVLHLSQN